MGDLILHRGAMEVGRKDLDLIPVPAATSSYQPVSHYQLAEKMIDVAGNVMTGFTLHKEMYGVTRNGMQMFAVLQYKNSDQMLGLSIGIRNSYDKSMVVGFCCGASVFVCDNLAFSGQIVVMRKHTKNVWNEIQERAIITCYEASHVYKQIQDDAERMRLVPLDMNAGYAHLGICSGHDFIGPRQYVVAQKEWQNPTHEEFKERNAWSLYNAITAALKSEPPASVMEKHIALHAYFSNMAR